MFGYSIVIKKQMNKQKLVFPLSFKLWKLIKDSPRRQMTVAISVQPSKTELVADGQCPHDIAFAHGFPLGPRPVFV